MKPRPYTLPDTVEEMLDLYHSRKEQWITHHTSRLKKLYGKIITTEYVRAMVDSIVGPLKVWADTKHLIVGDVVMPDWGFRDFLNDEEGGELGGSYYVKDKVNFVNSYWGSSFSQTEGDTEWDISHYGEGKPKLNPNEHFVSVTTYRGDSVQMAITVMDHRLGTKQCPFHERIVSRLPEDIQTAIKPFPLNIARTVVKMLNTRTKEEVLHYISTVEMFTEKPISVKLRSAKSGVLAWG